MINDVITSGIKLLPNFLKTTMQKGLVNGISEEVISLHNLSKKVVVVLENFNEVVEYLK